MKFYKYINTIPDKPIVGGEETEFNPGDTIMVRKGTQANYYWEQYKVAADGLIHFVRGITDDQWSRMEQMDVGFIDKVKNDTYTKEEVDERVTESINVSTADFYPLDPESTTLPTPPQVDGVGMDRAWTFIKQGVTYSQSGGPSLTGVVGEDNRAIWDGSEWKLFDMGGIPGVELPFAMLNSTSGSFNFNTVDKILEVSGIGSVNIGNDRFVYNSPQSITFPGIGSDSYFVLIFNTLSLGFEIVVQTQMSNLGKEYVLVATIYLNNDTRELVVNGISQYRQNGEAPPRRSPLWTPSRYITGDIVFHDNEFWIANQNTLPASEPSLSDRWDLLFNKYRRGQFLGSSSSVNFDLIDKKLVLSGTVTVSVGDRRYIVRTPQDIDFPAVSGGYYAMVLNVNTYQSSYGEISMVNVNDISSIDPKNIFVGVLVNINSNNELSVNGISDYLINGQPKSFRLPNWVDRVYRTGELVYHNNRTWIALDPNPIVGSTPGVSARWSELHPQKQGYFNGPASSLSFDLTEKNITTRGTSAIVINGERMLITAGQVVDFPSDNGGYFALLFRKSGGVVSTVSVSNLGSVDPSLILFGTYYHNNNINTIVVNGVPDYHINGVPKDEKFFTFDSGLPYYNATTDLSMTENDPIVLKDQSVDYLYSLYDDLMSQHPEYITKEQFGVQEDGNGGEIPLYYYRFKPSNLIKNTSSFGGDQRLKVVITAATHGGEKTCGMATWILMDAICNQWQDDEYLEALRWNCEFVVVACASPYQWNQNALGLSPGRLNANGVDPNRNFPQGWAGGNSIPGSTDYRGPSPLSEIECQAVYNLLKEEYTHGAIAFDFHTFVGSSAPYDIAWVIAPNKTNNQAQAFARLIAREYKKKLPMVDQDPDTPIARVSDNVAGGMTYKTYDAMGYRAYLMEINENFMLVPGYVRNDNYALKYGTESMANMLRMVIKSVIT